MSVQNGQNNSPIEMPGKLTLGEIVTLVRDREELQNHCYFMGWMKARREISEEMWKQNLKIIELERQLGLIDGSSQQ